ncbi:heparan-alpha-glucosaminide N-acetyltransferase domain-containing protein [Nocardioides caeni]|uniref:DUF1624 domain-containing protein n=1 Tax=Nocardioides caeni TaxID=574700 RepID=A0A4S8NLZ5_9ACTN|nr:heparan-alpha-glucosaminide N-acetyltransferase domain-containing protein [Nocardioides caeni]THV17888.1 DUF1624 domain-containing protein [Nocardioides caeni]
MSAWARIARPGRLIGVDLARTVALVGMIATHVLDGRTASGELTVVQELAGGRASALFAVLAGLSMALLSGGSTPLRGVPLGRATGGLAARAVLIGALGLLLGELDTGLAIILTYYAVLFCLGLPFLALRASHLAALAAGWVVAAPVLSHLVRPDLPERGWESPDLGALTEPGQLVSELLLTGYYPAVPWLAYLLAGMALGRIDLRRREVPRQLIGGGAVLVVLAIAVSQLCLSTGSVRAALIPGRVLTGDEVRRLLQDSQHGTTPTGAAWQWLLTAAPHSATPFDLAQTIGSALIAIGLCLAVVAVLPGALRPAAALVAGAGAMPLSLYSLHVAMRSPDVWPAEQTGTFGWHVAVVLGIGAAFTLFGRRGPLEWVVGWPGRRLTSAR